MWIKLSGELAVKLMPALSIGAASPRRATSPPQQDNHAGPTSPGSASRNRAKRFNCDHHGPNNTHDTPDCMVINGQQRVANISHQHISVHGNDVGWRVMGSAATDDAYLHLLPGTQHEVRLRLEETLVVGNTGLFDLLVGIRQMKPVADSLVQSPTAQLSFNPNVLEAPQYAVRVPMTRSSTRKMLRPCWTYFRNVGLEHTRTNLFRSRCLRVPVSQH